MKSNQELKSQLDLLQLDLTDKQVNIWWNQTKNSSHNWISYS